MKIAHKDIHKSVFIIAEIGANHEGDLDTAIRMIDAAAGTNADAVKFQTYRAEKIVTPAESQRYAHFQKLELSDNDFTTLAKHAQSKGILFLSTPFDIESVELLDPIVPAFKIASGDLTTLALIAAIAQKGKPILLSTGMGSIADIDAALATIRSVNQRLIQEKQVALLHCVSSYPTKIEEANLLSIQFLRQRYDLPVGYSDHVIGPLACETAVALGARIIEKHFTLEKEGKTFRDHALSADPADMKLLVEHIRSIEASFGVPQKIMQPVESSNSRTMRRSVAAKEDIAAGSILKESMLTFLRPATGIPAQDMRAIIGKRTKNPIARSHIITYNDIEV